MKIDLKTLRRIIPTITGHSEEKYAQGLDKASRWWAHSLMGPVLAGEIQTQGEDHPLHRISQEIIAYKAYWELIGQNDLIETANGFGVINDDKVAPASPARVKELKRSIWDQLQSSIGELCETLEDNAQYREKWKDSPHYTVDERSFLPTLRTFKKYGSFTGTYSDFVSIRHRIRAIFRSKFEPAISRELCDELCRQQGSGTLTPDKKTILEDLRFALAFYFNNDITSGESFLYRVSRILMSDPDKYPAFRDSELYRLMTRQQHKTKSILPLI